MNTQRLSVVVFAAILATLATLVAISILTAPQAGAAEENVATDQPVGTASPVARDGDSFSAEGTAERTDGKACIYAATASFMAAWNACDAAKYIDCNGSTPVAIEKREGYCRVKSVVVGSMTQHN